MSPHATLQKYFGYADFRPGQLEIVQAIINHQDTLAILPTGGGKSICFQVPGLILPNVTLVISPLISLMKDQVDRLNQLQIPATNLNSSLSTRELQQRYQQIEQNYYKFIYIAPERLFSHSFHKIIMQSIISLVVVDEAHCISEWGDSFRPEYRQISHWLESWCAVTRKPRPIVAAFTATATDYVQTDISHILNLHQPFKYLQSFKRTNLQLSIYNHPTRTSHELTLLRLIKKHAGQPGIIYTATRSATKYVATLIQQYEKMLGLTPVGCYHGGLTSQERSLVQQQFLSNHTPLIAATNAFGMGVDKPDIRFVIHFQLPSNLENYYQEVGRAGRDGKPAECYLLFRTTHLRIHHQLISNSTNNPQLRQHSLHKLKALLDVIHTSACRTACILQYFGETNAQSCENCDNCLSLLIPHDLLTGTLDHQELQLLLQLNQLRHHLAAQYQIPPAVILANKELCYLALLKPKSDSECLTLPGFGAGWLQHWWKHFQPILAENG
jgi:ATP-dependent DNA helicase RecQ